MSKKRAVVSLGHNALGYTTTEQWDAVKVTAKALADLVEADYQLTITHSNGPQISMIHKAMTELRRLYIDYTPAPMCVCSAMSQGYVGYDIQNSLKAELLGRGISKTVSTILTQVTVDPYDEAFYEPTKLIGRYMSADDAEIEMKKGNYVKESPGKGFRRIIAAPKPIDIVEIEAGDTYAYDTEGKKSQKAREDAAKEKLYSLLPEDQKQELTALFDEFEEYQTAEAKFAHAMDNLQPLLLNHSNNGGDWKEHQVSAQQVYGRQTKTKLGSEKLFEVTDKIIQEHIRRGNLQE